MRQSHAVRTAGTFFPLLAACALALAACGSDDDASVSTEAPAATEAPTTGAPAPSAAAAATQAPASTDDAPAAGAALADVCPETVVVQTSWFPEPEHGMAYHLAGTDGVVDAEKGTYTAPIGDTGVDIEIRAGGPFVGFQRVDAMMYQDESIMFGFVGSTEALEGHESTPTISVFAPWDRSLDAVIFSPERVDLTDITAMEETGAPLLALESNDDLLQMLINAGHIDASQIDYSYDGSLSRYVTADGGAMLLGYATNEPYRLEHETEQWMQPVEYFLLSDAGYEGYGATWAVTPETMESEADCLAAFIPMVQQAQIDYLHAPEEINAEIVEIVAEQNTFWTMSPGHAANGVQTMIEREIVGNGATETYGDIEEARIQWGIDQFGTIMSDQGRPLPDDLTAADLYSNEFIDPSITWTEP